jgi:hypothetical protein
MNLINFQRDLVLALLWTATARWAACQDGISVNETVNTKETDIHC